MTQEGVTSASVAAAQAAAIASANATAATLVGSTPVVRQTVLSGPVDSAGLPSFGGSTGASTVTTAGTLVATAAGGIANRTGTIVNPSWTGLTTNGTMYLYLDIAADGTVTTGSTTLAPVYQWGGTYSTTSGQHTFNIQAMQMQVGNGSAASQVYRVFAGEVTVASNVVSAITWYALMGRYVSADQSFASVGTKTTFSHNLGLQTGVSAKAQAVCQTAEGGWVAGEIADNLVAGWNPGTYIATFSPVGVDTRNTCSYTTGTSYLFITINKTNGNALIPPTAANWKLRMIVRRDW